MMGEGGSRRGERERERGEEQGGCYGSADSNGGRQTDDFGIFLLSISAPFYLFFCRSAFPCSVWVGIGERRPLS